MKLLFFILLFFFCLAEDTLSSYEAFDSILKEYVDSDGNVNYKGILENPYNFNQYFEFIEKISPNSHPKYFKTNNEKMAYWINTYNALIIKLMIENPGKDILNISMGHAIWLTKFRVGDENISLYKIEHQILKKMNDPRIHFAINCGSKSCPPLGRRIFLPETLDTQLEERAINFINNNSNVYIDYDSNTIFLNKIFKWYKKDFKNVKKYLLKYLDTPINYSDIKKFKIKYYDYDWSSNDWHNQ